MLFRSRAKAKRVCLVARRKSRIKYLTSLRPSTPMEVLWRRIRRFTRRSPRFSPTVIKHEDEYLTSPAVVADALEYAFSEHASGSGYLDVFRRLRNRDPPINFEGSPDEMNEPYNYLFTKHEFNSALSSMGDGAPGPDGIFSSMLRHLHPSATAYLMNLYHSIWIEGNFPSIWRMATVVAIPKQGKDPTIMDNRRPISMTCVPCKHMERMVSPRLMWELEARGGLTPHQIGRAHV